MMYPFMTLSDETQFGGEWTADVPLSFVASEK